MFAYHWNLYRVEILGNISTYRKLILTFSYSLIKVRKRSFVVLSSKQKCTLRLHYLGFNQFRHNKNTLTQRFCSNIYMKTNIAHLLNRMNFWNMYLVSCAESSFACTRSSPQSLTQLTRMTADFLSIFLPCSSRGRPIELRAFLWGRV